ncbi:MAG: 2-oxoacid:ferredoxin oxidoreductase subunit beta [Oscillospiraceae bacterium]|nr:2-oxoacid:ferredoxin oxidoreductase subunit beta [Oscillospiraceae bacterium]
MDSTYAEQSLTQNLPHIWCAGCGTGIVLGSILRGIKELNLSRQDVVITTGIGCCGKADDYVSTNAFHGTHGRALAFATGIKVAKPRLKVIVIMGDGDGATIGGNHLIHAARRNVDLTAIVVNNSNYGMTGGQLSATTPHGKNTSTSAFGNPERAFDLCELVGAAGANYVARGTVYHVTQLDNLIREAIVKEGFSFVEVVSPCPTHFGRRNKMGGPVAMMEWLKQVAIPKQKYDLMSEKKEDYIPIGKFIERDDLDFNTQYELARQRQACCTGKD